MRNRRPSRSLPLYGPALLLCCVAPAQIVVTATAATQLQVTAQGVQQTLPSGSDAAAVNLSASDTLSGWPTHGYTFVDASMTTRLDTGDPARLRFSVHQDGSIDDQGGFGLPSFSVGSHDIRLDFASTAPVAGVLVIAFAAEIPDPYTWVASATVDVGDDGTVEFDTTTGPPFLSSLATTLPAGTTSVLVHTETSGWGSPSNGYDWASLSLDLTFVPNAHCDVESFGESCRDLRLSALPTSLGTDYVAQGLEPNGLGLVVFGPGLPAPWTLPFAPGCDLLVGLTITTPHVADATGRVNAFLGLSSLTLPPQFRISMQFAGVTAGGQVLTSNGIHLDCPPN